MLTAKEAQDLTEEAKTKLNLTLNKIEEGILLQTRQGRSQYTYMVRLSNPEFHRKLHNHLRTLGYGLTYTQNNHFMHISWA